MCASLLFYTLTHVVSEHNTMHQKYGSPRLKFSLQNFMDFYKLINLPFKYESLKIKDTLKSQLCLWSL